MTTHDGAVLHWYDFICPFCYVGQSRNAIFARYGLEIVQLPFQAHPDIPRGGIAARPRHGALYAMLEHEATEAGLPLHWPEHLPNTRTALAAAEWVRRHQPGAFALFHQKLFAAHFALGEDLEDCTVIDRHAREASVDLADLHVALAEDRAQDAVSEAEMIGRRYGVAGTPAWLVGRQLISGLRPAAEFERLAQHASQMA